MPSPQATWLFLVLVSLVGYKVYKDKCLEHSRLLTKIELVTKLGSHFMIHDLYSLTTVNNLLLIFMGYNVTPLCMCALHPCPVLMHLLLLHGDSIHNFNYVDVHKTI